MSQPNYGPCQCHECQGIHCLVWHPGHSCKEQFRLPYFGKILPAIKKGPDGEK